MTALITSAAATWTVLRHVGPNHLRDVVCQVADQLEMLAALREAGEHSAADVLQVRGPAQHGLYSNQMALVTSDCDAMRIHDHQMALITSDCDARADGQPAAAAALRVLSRRA